MRRQASRLTSALCLVFAAALVLLVAPPVIEARPLKRNGASNIRNGHKQHKSFPLHGSAGGARRASAKSKPEDKKKRLALPQAASLLRDLERHNEALNAAKAALKSAEATQSTVLAQTAAGSVKPTSTKHVKTIAGASSPAVAKRAAANTPVATAKTNVPTVGIDQAVLVAKVTELEKQVSELKHQVREFEEASYAQAHSNKHDFAAAANKKILEAQSKSLEEEHANGRKQQTKILEEDEEDDDEEEDDDAGEDECKDGECGDKPGTKKELGDEDAVDEENKEAAEDDANDSEDASDATPSSTVTQSLASMYDSISSSISSVGSEVKNVFGALGLDPTAPADKPDAATLEEEDGNPDLEFP